MMYETDRHNLYYLLEEMNDSCSEVDLAIDTITAVVDIHTPFLLQNGKHIFCDGCGQIYPCATIKIIEEYVVS